MFFSYPFFFYLIPQAEPLPPCGRHRGNIPTGTPPTEESGPLAENTPLTGYEPNILDDLHHSETTELFFPGAIQRHGALVLVRHGTR